MAKRAGGGRRGGTGRKRSAAREEPAEKKHHRPAGPRPIWSGTISFGLVSVPVHVFSAARSARTALRMLAPDGAPLSRRYVCSVEERDVPLEELVRGHELEDGDHVVLTAEELESVEPRKSRDIDLRQFVDAAEIDPFLFERPYVLTPRGDSNKPYRLLAAVMEREKRAGIATFVMRDKESLVAIFAQGGILWAETLRFADELRPPEEAGLEEGGEADAGALEAFRAALRSLAAKDIEPSELRDDRERALAELARAKHARGEDLLEAPLVDEEPEDSGTSELDDEDEEGGAGAPDLFDVIRLSLAGEVEPPGDGRAPASARKQPAKSAKARARPASEDLAALTKDELYERAKAQDLPGRASMSKDELVRALARRR